MTAKSILVLDDDKSFRELMVRLLQPTGFNIVEARATRDALALAPKSNLVLCIVDFKMPEEDGVTFISKLREAGKDIPIVFVSGTWCDAKTFSWLRNILRVSLVLQKPIQPHLFLQQIESLLPADRPMQLSAEAEASYQELLAAAEGMERELTFEEVQRIEELDPERKKQVQELLERAAAEKAIRDIQKELAGDVPPQWEELAKSLRALQADLRNNDLRQSVLLQAHSLLGSAGSLGLMVTSEAARKIENYARMLDADDDLGQEILWLEVFRALADGDTELRQLVQEEVVAQPVQAGHVLLLGTEERLHQFAHCMTASVDAQITYTSSPVESAVKAAATRFDAAILDVSRFGKHQVFGLAREMRMTHMNDGVPLAFLLDEGEQLTESERVFYGGSTVLRAPATQESFEECLRTLAAVNRSQQVRILTVDDDNVLTTFIERILTSHGMAVSTLNEPINILETLEKVRPDLVLLDVIMPGLSGYDICRMLRASERYSNIPIIFLTSKSDAQGRSAAFQAGADDFLAKPIISDELLLRVKLQLQKSKSEREREGSDDLTGLLSEAMFLSVAEDAFADADAEQDKVALGVVQINDLGALTQFGTFAQINVLVTLGKLIQARFPAETLRGRVEPDGFVLALRGAEADYFEDALRLLTGELADITFTGEQGTTFSAAARAAAASYPRDGNSVAALLDAAARRLQAVASK